MEETPHNKFLEIAQRIIAEYKDKKVQVWAERRATKNSVYYTVYIGQIGKGKSIVGGATSKENLKYKMRAVKHKIGLNPDTKHIVIDISSRKNNIGKIIVK